MNYEEYIEELRNIVDDKELQYLGMGCAKRIREGKPINSELSVLKHLAEKYLRYKKDLKAFKKMKIIKHA